MMARYIKIVVVCEQALKRLCSDKYFLVRNLHFMEIITLAPECGKSRC